jgi:outer membrane protein OmpA-like peptidoglycan-associated protein
MSPSRSDLNHKNWLHIAIVLLLIITPSIIQAAESFGTNTAEFLKIKPEAGPAGMGEAYTGIADDAAALVYNPAGLALLDRTELTGTQLLWFNSINMTHLAFAHPFESGTGFGVDLLWIDFGNFDSTGIPGNSISVQNLLINAGFGKSLGDMLQAGINVKGLYEKFIDQTSFGASLDAGVMLKLLSRNITLGLTARNLGFVTGTSDSLPMEAALGIGFRLWNGRHDYMNIDLDASKVLTTDNIFFGAGIEGTFWNVLSLRLGFRFNNALEMNNMSFSNIQSLTQLSAGVGITMADYSVDYSYTPMGDLGVIQRMGLTLRFGESMYERSLAEQKALVVPKAIEAPSVNVEEGRIRSVSFKPNVPQEKIKEWTLNIKSSDGRIVKTFTGVGEVPKNLSWDGTDSLGRIAKADANYIFDFKAKDNEGQIVKTIDQIIQPKKFDFMNTEDRRFVPIKGREMLVAPVTLLVSSDSEERKQVPFVMVNEKIKDVKDWAFDIYNRAGAPLKKFKGAGIMPSYLVWDGKDYDGNYVDDLKSCKYVLTINGMDGKRSEIKDRQVIRDPFIIASKTKELRMAERIFFDSNSADLTPEMEARLSELGAEISKETRTQIYIQGHSSAEGDRSYNVLLSQLRAKTVLRYLVEKYKLSPLSITTVGYGSDIPVDSNDSEETRAKSRRVEIIIMGETR